MSSQQKTPVSLSGKTILVTGAAGFIGSNLARRLLQEEDVQVIGLDNMNDYYDVRIKESRLADLESYDSFVFIQGDISDEDTVNGVFETYRPAIVVNLAAQAGVRYSITNPEAYLKSNLEGFFRILEACRKFPVEHLVYASSSSVYGSNAKVPYSTEDKVDNPVSLYAATKKSNELMSHAYSKLYNIPSTGLRFFTVYGPAGRPDMAYFGFTNKLLAGKTIQIFNYGNCMRDFTYVDDIVEGVIRVMKKAPALQNGEDGLPIPPYAVYNIGNSHPVNLLDFVDILQQELVAAGVLPFDYDFEAHKELVPMQPGDVPVTYADTTDLQEDFGYQPSTSLQEGLRAFARWYKDFYMPEEAEELTEDEELEDKKESLEEGHYSLQKQIQKEMAAAAQDLRAKVMETIEEEVEASMEEEQEELLEENRVMAAEEGLARLQDEQADVLLKQEEIFEGGRR